MARASREPGGLHGGEVGGLEACGQGPNGGSFLCAHRLPLRSVGKTDHRVQGSFHQRTQYTVLPQDLCMAGWLSLRRQQQPSQTSSGQSGQSPPSRVALTPTLAPHLPEFSLNSSQPHTKLYLMMFSKISIMSYQVPVWGSIRGRGQIQLSTSCI